MTTDTNDVAQEAFYPSLKDVLEVVRTEFPNDPSVVWALEACLSATAALCIKGLEGCPAIRMPFAFTMPRTTGPGIRKTSMEKIEVIDAMRLCHRALTRVPS